VYGVASTRSRDRPAGDRRRRSLGHQAADPAAQPGDLPAVDLDEAEVVVVPTVHEDGQPRLVAVLQRLQLDLRLGAARRLDLTHAHEGPLAGGGGPQHQPAGLGLHAGARAAQGVPLVAEASEVKSSRQVTGIGRCRPSGAVAISSVTRSATTGQPSTHSTGRRKVSRPRLWNAG
jgi:hypothetical protein